MVDKGENTDCVLGPLALVDLFVLWELLRSYKLKMVSSITFFYVSKVLSGLTLSFFATI